MGDSADLVQACRDMLADGEAPETVLGIIRSSADDLDSARGLVALVFGVAPETAHEIIADSATWADRREPQLDPGRILDDFRGGA